MENSIALARFIGPYIILIGVGLLFNRKRISKIMEDFPNNPGLVYVTGLLTFVTGLAIVLLHNLWVADWRVIITLFGWIALLKGAWLVILPSTLNKITKWYTDNPNLVVISWSIMLLLGIFLAIKGFMQ